MCLDETGDTDGSEDFFQPRDGMLEMSVAIAQIAPERYCNNNRLWALGFRL